MSEEITGLTGMWSDLDLRSDAHSRKALPATIEQALTILPSALPPTIIICTGNGLHCWWLLKEPYIFDDEQDRRDAMRIVARWHTLLQLNAASHGWAYERLSDLARVLRIPGTHNVKNPSEPKESLRIPLRTGGTTCVSSRNCWTPVGSPTRKRRSERPGNGQSGSRTNLWSSNIAARIPEETLNAWMEADMRFCNTWLRQRHDLKDQSNSGYDLALACFGVAAGLSEQQIVDLIVHHRSHHGLGHRTRADYFQRTIAKGRRRPAARLFRQRHVLPQVRHRARRTRRRMASRVLRPPGLRTTPGRCCARTFRRRSASPLFGSSSSREKSPCTTWRWGRRA